MTSDDASAQEQKWHAHRPADVLWAKPARALVALVLLGCLLDGIPRLSRWHLFPKPAEHNSAVARAAPVDTPLTVGEATIGEVSETSSERIAGMEAPRNLQGPIAKADPSKGSSLPREGTTPAPLLEDPSGRALNSFFASLERTAQKQPGAVTRILHFGDSIVASDYVSSTLRRRFQEQFGDAGHGFTLLANAWPAYFHEGVSRFATSGWLISRVVGPLANDGWHGLGGVSFRAPPHLLARVGTAKKGDVGRKVSRFILAYVESPDGGQADIRIDGIARDLLDTKAPEKRFRTATYEVPDGEHEFELQTTKGTSRFFGLVLERDLPGVVLDAIGIQGARIRFLDKQDDEHYREQLTWRDPGLVIYQFGANESADGYAYSMTEYYQTMRAVIAQQQAAIPNASCLIIGAMDRATRKGDEIRSLSIIPLIVEQQRRVAFDLGCAFFDTFRAMGGTGSMPSWFRRDLGQSDLTHPTAVGAEMLGNWLYRAILRVSTTAPAASVSKP